MICVSIAQESRKFALVDMLNAAAQCDLLELRLDCFAHEPDLKELISQKRKPVILSCRRFADGGQWKGSESDRLLLLRQCIVSGAEYVEIEWDVADQIRSYPGCQRVISYTNLRETPENIEEIYDEMRRKQPDVLKLTTLARTPEEAWPLLQIVSRASTPTVVTGLGKPGITLSLLGKRLGAPWTYAALERGMETYPGQPTIHDLENLYHLRGIDRHTRFVAVTGFTPLQSVLIAALNAGFAERTLNLRCLPVGMGNAGLFRKIMNAVKFAAVVFDPEQFQTMLPFAETTDPAVQHSRATDLLLRKEEKWIAWNLYCRAAVLCLEDALRRKQPADAPLHNRIVAIHGANPLAHCIAYAILQRGGHVIILGHDREKAHALAQELGCRFAQTEVLYSTPHDVLVLCQTGASDTDKTPGQEKPLHPGFLKPAHIIMDLTPQGDQSPLCEEARSRGATVVGTAEFVSLLSRKQLELLTGRGESAG